MSIEKHIIDELTQSFQPLHLQVVNESHGHSVAPGSETHFKVTLVSEAFEGCRSVKRHQMVYACLAEALQNGVHALALHTFTSQEWQDKGETAVPSPACLGGSKKA